MKVFNELRRNVINKLNEQRLYKIPFKKEEYYIDVPSFKLEKNTNTLINNYVNDKVLKLPRIIENYNNYDINNHYLITELGALNHFKNMDSDFSLNAVNSYSVALLHSLGVNKITLSLELEYDEVEELINAYEYRYHKHPNLEVITSSNVEVMVCKFNLNKYYNLENLIIKNNSNKYILKTNDNYMSIYLANKIVKEDNYFKIGVNNIRKDINI